MEKNKRKDILERKKIQRERRKIFQKTIIGDSDVSENGKGVVGDVLDGTIFVSEPIQKQMPFVFYVVLIVILYMSFNFMGDKILLKTDITNEEIKELKFRYIYNETELIKLTKASSLRELFKNEGLQMSKVPPKKIYINQ